MIAQLYFKDSGTKKSIDKKSERWLDHQYLKDS